MTPAEQRRALLGDAVLAHIQELVNAAPPPDAETIARLRRIFHGTSRQSTPAQTRRAA
ncbi:hypothetical protein ACFXD5_06835 [Streptomyces sp. NPDC059385]|uniref:hypothetical protein n=1 Tax=Streptomyces sp. NPDC059385 TaxID=3346817 RepID=UPI00367D2EA2